MDTGLGGSGIIPNKQEIDEAMSKEQRRTFIREQRAVIRERITPNNVESEFQYLKDQQITWKNETLNFDTRMERFVPRSFTTEGLSQQDFTEVVIERGSLNSSQIGSISEDKIIEAVGNLVQITGISEVGPFSLSNNTGVTLTSTLSDKQDPNRVILGVFEVDAWQTSIAANNQIPYGSNTINAGYDVVISHDINRNQNSDSPHTGITGMHQTYNKTGSTQDIYWRVRWRYLGRNTAS